MTSPTEVPAAIAVLRQAGISPEQYASYALVPEFHDSDETWIIKEERFASWEAAFAEATRRAKATGKWVEISHHWRGAESWVIKP